MNGPYLQRLVVYGPSSMDNNVRQACLTLARSCWPGRNKRAKQREQILQLYIRRHYPLRAQSFANPVLHGPLIDPVVRCCHQRESPCYSCTPRFLGRQRALARLRVTKQISSKRPDVASPPTQYRQPAGRPNAQRSLANYRIWSSQRLTRAHVCAARFELPFGRWLIYQRACKDSG